MCVLCVCIYCIYVYCIYISHTLLSLTQLCPPPPHTPLESPQRATRLGSCIYEQLPGSVFHAGGVYMSISSQFIHALLTCAHKSVLSIFLPCMNRLISTWFFWVLHML